MGHGQPGVCPKVSGKFDNEAELAVMIGKTVPRHVKRAMADPVSVPAGHPVPALFDVAIVGFGPAGMVAAALPGQADLSVYVCDRLSGVVDIPRAIALDHEILRVFQQLGLVDAISPYFEPFTPSEFLGADGQLIRRMTMVAPP